VTAPREIADLMAELETLRQLNADAKNQLARTRNIIAGKRQEIAVLEFHEYQLVTVIDQRIRKADRLLDELSLMRATQDTADAIVDEGVRPARPTGVMPDGRMV